MYPLKQRMEKSSRIVMGCMGLGGPWDDAPVTQEAIHHAYSVIDAALDYGITQFDHADIYTLGKAEQVFGEYLQRNPHRRDNILLQSKCAIRFADETHVGRYDFSADYIEQSVNRSLQRLHTDYLDILLLHRPDALVQPDEVAHVVDKLLAEGKIRALGVSNMHQYQIDHLQAALSIPIVCNQLPVSLRDLDLFEVGLTVGDTQALGKRYPAGIVEHAQKHKIQIQAWGCLAQGLYSGRDTSNESAAVQNTAQLVASLAVKHSASPEAIVLAFLLRHPAGIQPVIGTTDIDRIRACMQAEQVELSRDEWYQLLVTSRGQALP